MKASSISIWESIPTGEESPTETPEEIVNEVWKSSPEGTDSREGANRIPSGDDSGELIEEAARTEEKATNNTAKIATKQPVSEPQEIETTLNQGMQFLNGIFKMATGKELITEGKGITVNRETGEVTMKFKLPGF